MLKCYIVYDKILATHVFKYTTDIALVPMLQFQTTYGILLIRPSCNITPIS